MLQVACEFNATCNVECWWQLLITMAHIAVRV